MDRAKTGKLYILLGVLAFLNLFDLAATLMWCNSLGISVELNPLMRQLLIINPLLAVSYKVLILAAFVIAMRICASSNYRLAVNGTVMVVFIYAALFCWHLVGPVMYLL